MQSVKQIGVSSTRRVLRTIGIQPETIKALVRKPAPVHGGPRVRRWPWPRRRHFGKPERRAVWDLMTREIHDGGAIQYEGREEKAYCAAFAKYLGGGFADGVNSGTNAVYIALRALDLAPGSEVVVAPTTDAGGTMPVVMNLCIPVPSDSDRDGVHMSADQIKAVLTESTSAIIVTHVAGYPADMDPILDLAKARGIPVIEDCAQAHGAMYKGRMVGTLGTIAAFSTMFSKHHTTGGQGGVVFTNDEQLFTKARRVADRGKPFGVPGNPGNLIASLNFNQDEISMAIGRVQLAKLPAGIAARRAFVAQLARETQAAGVSVVGDPPGCASSYLFLMLRLDRSRLRCDSEAFAAALRDEGIADVEAGYRVYPTDQPWHHHGLVFGSSKLPWSLRSEQPEPRAFPLPNAHAANQALVRLDLHEGLGPREARDLAAAIHKLARHFAA